MNRQRRKNKETEPPWRCKIRKGERERRQAKINFFAAATRLSPLLANLL